MNNYDIVIVGAGISGATLAERYASRGAKVLVIEKRYHIGGNCYDEKNKDGLLISKYGAHLFHTNYDDVWQYVQKFSEWYPYEHRVLAYVDNKLVPVPVNIKTVNTLFNLQIKNEAQMKSWLKIHQIQNKDPENGKDAALARVGQELYEKIFKNYTKKQWNRYPEELDAEVLNRIPVHTTFDDRHFTDKYQALPKGGYTKIFERMLSNKLIEVVTDTDFFDVRDKIKGYKKLFYTGPIDQFFELKLSTDKYLEYRSIDFKVETHDTEYYQVNSVINYPNDFGFTRIVEYKHLTGQKHPKTTISKEYGVDYVPGVNEPYYPVPSPKNRAIYEEYRKKAFGLTNIYFVGRLANYKYFNMDQAFKNALDLFRLLEPFEAEGDSKKTGIFV